MILLIMEVAIVMLLIVKVVVLLVIIQIRTIVEVMATVRTIVVIVILVITRGVPGQLLYHSRLRASPVMSVGTDSCCGPEAFE